MGLSKRLRQAGFLVLMGLALLQFGQGIWIQAKALLAQELIRLAWEEARATGSAIKPWPWSDTWPVAELRLPGAPPLYVLSGIHGQALAFGPGHQTGTVLPGEPGVSVVAGHRDTHFRDLKTLTVGDALTARSQQGGSIQYQVYQTRIVDIRSDDLALEADRTELILLTCYPFDAVDPNGPLRYLVRARPTALLGHHPIQAAISHPGAGPTPF